jgi:PAS domain S-box-containing protein
MTAPHEDPQSSTIRKSRDGIEKTSTFGDWLSRPSSIAVTACGLFILIFGIAIFLGYRQFEAARHNTLIADKTTANLLADLIREHEISVINLLQSYANRPLFVDAVKRKDPVAATRHLVDLKRNHEIDLTFMTDRSGVLWMNFPAFPEAIGKDLSDRDWYKGISVHWQPYVSLVFNLIVADKPLAVAICVPVLDEKGRTIGILGNSHRLSFLANTIQRVPLSSHTTVSVLDRTGHILYSNKYPYLGEIVEYPSYLIIKQALKGKRQQVEFGDPHKDQTPVYLSIAAIEDIGWAVIVERERSDILRSEGSRFIELGAVSFLLFVLITLCLIYVRQVSLFRKTEELLQAEIMLRQSKEAERETSDYLDKLIRYANAPIIVWDPQFRITRFNHAFEDLTGLKAEDVLGKEIDLLFPADRREEYLGYIRQTTGGERWEVREILILKTDETVRTVLWNTATIYGQDGKTLIATIAQGQDVTDRKQAEEEVCKLNVELEQRVIERTTLLEASNKELEAFSYSVSHDLRAPLRGIDGFSLALLEECGNKLNDAEKAYLARIRKATQKMGFLIDDMLKLSQVTRSEFHQEPVNLSRMVQEIAEKSREHNADRTVDVSVQEEIVVQGDFYLMQIAMGNLMENAWKFTAKVDVPRIEFGATKQAGETIYFVRDNGIGFDMTYVNKLFGAFQRLHTFHEYPGTGIGLATVKRIINRHGGRVWAEGEVGKGATFYFTLPE